MQRGRLAKAGKWIAPDIRIRQDGYKWEELI